MKEKKPLALYIHIPFCRQKCLYCDFLSGRASELEKEAYVKKLLEEIEYWKQVIYSGYWVQTVFIGGGTPTCLNPEQLLRIGKKLGEVIHEAQRLSWKLSDGQKKLNQIHASNSSIDKQIQTCEFTIEANPGTLTKEHVQVLKEIGVNRISLGLQSAQENELKALGRIHSYHDFLKSFHLLREHGFDNINIDLMADIPKQTLESYHSTLSAVLWLEPEHISSYSLIVEEGTPFYQMQEEGKLIIPDEETDRMMYQLTQELLYNKGYERYEISNYAKQGKECRHNLTYWQMEEYLGMGLGASSYFQGYRFSNTDSLKVYLETTVDKLQKERYLLSKKEEMEEYVFLGLRMRKGISTIDYQKRFGVAFRKQYERVLPLLFEKCLLAEDGNHDRIYLTNQGIDVSNIVLADFLIEE